MTTPLPVRFTSRPAALDDAERAAELANLCAIELTGEPETGVHELRSDWQSPVLHPETDVRLVFAPDGAPGGALVGYAGVWDAEPHVQVHAWAHVHPDQCGQGIGTYLLAWTEARAMQAIAKAPEGARVTVGQGRPSTDKAGSALLLAHGYSTVRHFIEMRIEMSEPPPTPDLPAGIRVRSMADLSGTAEERLQAVVDADHEIFRDHWGFVEQPPEQEFADWKHWVDNDPHHDPRLWFLAMEGDEIAGLSLCAPWSPQAPGMAYVHSLGVRRPWRRRGVALALLHHSFGCFYRQGIRKVSLGVDAQSLTGATRLYEKAGMHPHHQATVYEKELRPGADLSTQSLSET
jgi:GNAT superfamily N-acetyltransferase